MESQKSEKKTERQAKEKCSDSLKNQIDQSSVKMKQLEIQFNSHFAHQFKLMKQLKIK